jgi:hypothetical protein
MRVELALLRVLKIGAFLEAGEGSTAFPIYKAAQLTCKPLADKSRA